MTGSDRLEEKGNKEVVSKDIWLDKGSPEEKENQQLIYDRLHQIQKEEIYRWIDINYWKCISDVLENIPDSLPLMRILHDSKGVDHKECLKKALPNHTILSSAVPQVLSGRNITLLTSQTGISYSAIGTSHGVPATLDPGNCPQHQYKAKTQYQQVYAQVGYALHDALLIDKAFKAINDVLTGDNIFSFAEYYVC